MIKHRSFKDARKFVRSLGLKNQVEWREYYKSGNKPDDIPSRPDKAYNGIGWKNLGDWLGTGRIASRNRKYRSFDKARKFAARLGLKNKGEWADYVKLGKQPNDIPRDPRNIYKKQGTWKGWGDFLGTGRVANQDREYLSPIEAKIEARKIAKKLKIKTQKDWADAYKDGKIPANLPSGLWDAYGRQRRRIK